MPTGRPMLIRHARHVVRAGESPRSIAAFYGQPWRWREIVAVNPWKPMRGETFVELADGEVLVLPAGMVIVDPHTGQLVGVGSAPDPAAPPTIDAGRILGSTVAIGLVVGAAYLGTKLLPRHPALGGAAGVAVAVGVPMVILSYAFAKGGM